MKTHRFFALFLMVLLVVSVSVIFPVPLELSMAQENRSSFRVKEQLEIYSLKIKENSEWLSIQISHNITNYEGFQEPTITEYVGLDKTRRGEIGFTKNSHYVGRLIPILVGKVGNNWFLMPITNAENITSYGSEIGEDEEGAFTKVFYKGSGTMTAYKYNDWNTQFPADLMINELSVKIRNETGTAKIFVNVTSTEYSLDDSGFGFLFIPKNASMFRYASFYGGDRQERTVDLLNVGIISDVGLILNFWDQAQQKLGIQWDWEDLYSLGNSTHFEVLDIKGMKGLITGSYGYGPVSTVVVDPTLTLSSSASEISIENTWDEGGSTVGYNFTILSAHMEVDRMYNYYGNAWMWDADQSAGYHSGFFTRWRHFDTPNWDVMTHDYSCTWEIYEQSDTRIRVNVTSAEMSNGVLESGYAHYIVTAYAGSPLIFLQSQFTNNNGTEVDIDYIAWYIYDYQDGRAEDSDWNTDFDDNVHACNHTNGHVNIFGIYEYNVFQCNKDLSGRNSRLNPSGTSGTWLGDSYPLADGETEGFTIVFNPHNESTDTGAEAIVDEWDNELTDDYADISAVSGATSDGRNNMTGAFDFTHSSGNDISFTATPVDSENNFTAFHIDNWNNNAYLLKKGGAVQTEDSDFYAYYNSTTLDLEIIMAEPVTTASFQIFCDLIIYSTDHSPNEPEAGRTFTITGLIYYYGTTTPPEDPTGITVKLSKSGFVIGSTTTITNGQFTLSHSEPEAGDYTYLIYAVKDGVPTVQNQTENVNVVKGASGSSGYTPPTDTTEPEGPEETGGTVLPDGSELLIPGEVLPMWVCVSVVIGIILLSAYSSGPSLKSSRKEFKKKAKEKKKKKWKKEGPWE